MKDVEDWSRASSMTVYQGKMFVSTADCFRAALSHPRENEIRGKVYSFRLAKEFRSTAISARVGNRSLLCVTDHG